MTCPHLSYERRDGEQVFDTPRAYCTLADRFVQPMRADICNDRYDLVHDQDCEIFLAADAAAEGDRQPGR